jgi:DivIVA domain-containing protein
LDVVPLTPTVVDCVTFDRAPLGRRGYNEDQVDDFLDRVQATLAGKDNLTAQNVRDVVFDPAAFIRRGYHEDQVDEFLDLVVEELDRRAGNPRQAPRTGGVPVARTGSPTAPVPPVPFHLRQTPPPGALEQTEPMLFSLPPSMPGSSTQPLKREEPAASGPPAEIPAPTNGKPVAAQPTDGESVEETTPQPSAPEEPSAETSTPADAAAAPPSDAETTSTIPATGQPPTTEPPLTAAETPTSSGTAAPQPPDTAPEPPAQDASPTEAEAPAHGATAVAPPPPAANEAPQQSSASKEPEAWRDSDHLALPLPPAPPGERGYRPGDVERLMKLLAAKLADPGSPGPDDLADLKLSRTFFVGQGYHTGAVDTLRQAWLDELTRRAL